jgi:hypothetical protein
MRAGTIIMPPSGSAFGGTKSMSVLAMKIFRRPRAGRAKSGQVELLRIQEAHVRL